MPGIVLGEVQAIQQTTHTFVSQRVRCYVEKLRVEQDAKVLFFCRAIWEGLPDKVTSSKDLKKMREGARPVWRLQVGELAGARVWESLLCHVQEQQ